MTDPRFTNREGTAAPDVALRLRKDGQWATVQTGALFAGKRVVVFSLPGAFTPTCSTSHVPRYDELAPAFAAAGVDAIYCVSVNDTFVMDAWADAQGVEHVQMLPDGNGDFTEAMGMLVDKADLGFGRRSWRYSMLVEDGVVTRHFIEPDVPGDPYEVSDADTMLGHVAPDARPTPDIFMLTKPFCGHCARAKALLDEAGVPFESVDANPRMLRAVSETATTPRVFIDGELIGGADELGAWLAARG
jgi:glutathione-dependent peroxiredoxin